MKIIYLILPAVAFSACGNGEKTGEKNMAPADTLAAAEIPEAESSAPEHFKINADPALLDGLDKNKRKVLTWFFGKENAVNFLSGMKAIEQVKTDADLYTCYHFMDSVCSVTTDNYMNREDDPLHFSAHIDSISSLYHAELEPLFPYLQFTCEAECTMPRIMLSYNAFAKLAEKTDGSQDDRFFELRKTVYPDCDCDGIMASIWFDQTWDYGGNSLLGGGHHYKVLKLAQETKPGNVFEKQIRSIEQMCMEDALTWNTLFHTAEKAIDELKKIKTLNIGTENRKKIEERINHLQNPGKDLQLDCEHNECQYG